MERRRITFMLAEGNDLEKRILDWIEGLRADRSVPLKVHLVPVIARGLGLTNGSGVSASAPPLEKPPRRRATPKPRVASSKTADEGAPEIRHDSTVRPGADDSFPVDRLEFD